MDLVMARDRVYDTPESIAPIEQRGRRPLTTSRRSRLTEAIGSPWSPDWLDRDPVRMPS